MVTSKTILRWNTGRQYTDKGQPIVAIQLADGRVMFHDCARGITGILPATIGNFHQNAIMSAYDAGNYEAHWLTPELRSAIG